jgi:hypothetical protein
MDVPRCEDLSLLQKRLHNRGIQQNSCLRLNDKFGDLVPERASRPPPPRFFRFLVSREIKGGPILGKYGRWPVRRRGGPRRGNARHRTKHAAKKVPLTGPPKAHAELVCRMRRRRNNDSNMRQWWRARRETAANDSASSKILRREGYLATVQLKLVIRAPQALAGARTRNSRAPELAILGRRQKFGSSK